MCTETPAKDIRKKWISHPQETTATCSQKRKMFHYQCEAVVVQISVTTSRREKFNGCQMPKDLHYLIAQKTQKHFPSWDHQKFCVNNTFHYIQPTFLGGVKFQCASYVPSKQKGQNLPRCEGHGGASLSRTLWRVQSQINTNDV